MKQLAIQLSTVTCVALLAGCATTHDKYDWGSYEHTLYVYYKEPAAAGAMMGSLQSIITDADRTHEIVPPGIYAEYGYLLLKQGKSQEAVSEFKQEESHWPESRVFMDRMIQASLRSTSPQTNK